MTKLEEEMVKAINGPYWPLEGEVLEIAKQEARAAAEVAKKYIEAAVLAYHHHAQYFIQSQGFMSNSALDIIHRRTEDWMKENGITESQPTDKAPGQVQDQAGENIKE